jgi:homoserine O-acetyltransferase
MTTRKATAKAAAVYGDRLAILESTDLLVPTYEGDFVLEGHLLLECGRTLVRPTLHYAVYGRLNEAADNAVLVCHALSGSALVGGWWPGLFAPGGIVDLERDCVVCVNLLGSCYGSTGPGSVDEETGQVYGVEFPLISIRDNVRAQARLLDSLGIERLKLAVGGSIGGMQVLDWSILYPERIARAVVIAVAPLGAMGLALNHLQRRAIQDDPEWLGGNYIRQPRKGLALARQIAMLSYKSAALFEERFARQPNRNGEDPWALDNHGGGLGGGPAGRFDVAGFLDYQGERFLERFDANAYLAILRTMDTWDPTRGFRSASDAFGRIQAEVTLVGISSDWLFPPSDVRRMAEEVANAGAKAEYREMVTEHGHDAFLAEQEKLVRLLHLKAN